MKFSILMPTFNHEKYIKESIDSIISQDYTNWELIIINDGSTDNTLNIINDIASTENRIKIIDKPNGGTATALNTGINNSTGEWIFWLSSDDLFESNKLSEHYKYISQNDAHFIHTNHFLINDQDYVKYESKFDYSTLSTNPTFQSLNFFNFNYVNGVSISVSKKLINDIGLFNTDLKAGHDFDYWLRSSLKYRIHYLNNFLSTTRLHSNQDTSKGIYRGILDSGLSCYEILKNNSELIFQPIDNFSENDLLDLINTSLKIITNKNSYVNLFGFQDLFVSELSSSICKLTNPKTISALTSKLNEMNRSLSDENINLLIEKLINHKASNIKQVWPSAFSILYNRYSNLKYEGLIKKEDYYKYLIEGKNFLS